MEVIVLGDVFTIFCMFVEYYSRKIDTINSKIDQQDNDMYGIISRLLLHVLGLIAL